MARLSVRALSVLLWVLVALVALTASLLVHLDTDAGRRTVCGELTRLVDDAIVGGFSATCEHLGLDAIRLTDVVFSLDDEAMIRAARVEAEPALFSLLRGDIRVARARVEDAEVDLRDLDRFVSVFDLSTPSIEEPSDEPLTLPDIVVREVALVDVRTRLPEGLDTRLDFDGVVRLGPGIHAEIDSLHIEAERAGAALADLRMVGVFDTMDESRVELSMAAGATTLRVNARAVWGEHIESGPTEVRVERLDAHVDPRTLRSPALAGWTDGIPLAVPVDVSLRAEGWLDDARARGSIDTPAGNANLRVGWQGSVLRAEVDTEEVRLAQLLEGVPGTVSGRVDAALDGDLRLRVHGEALRYDEYTVPEVVAEATLLPDAIQIASVSLPHLEQGGHLHVDGRVGFDGAVDLHVDADLPQVARDPNLVRLVPGLRGGLRADADVRVGSTLDVRGRASLRNVSHGAARVASLRVNGSVSGAFDAPEVRFEVQAEGVSAGDLGGQPIALRRLGATVRGSGTRYHVRGDGTDARDRPIALDVRADLADATRLEGMVRASLVLDEPYRLDLRRLVIVGEDLDVDATLEAESGLHVDARGRVGRRSDLRATLRQVRLAWVDQRFGLGLDLRGVVSGRAELHGSLRVPRGVVHAEVRGLSAQGAPVSDVDLDLDLSQPGVGRSRHARAEMRMHVHGEHGTARLRGTVDFPTTNPQQRVEEAALALTLDADEVQVQTWAAPFTDTPLEGLLRAGLSIRGTPAAPVVNGSATVERLILRNGDPIDVGLTSSMRVGMGEVDVTLRDARGLLARVHATSEALGRASTLAEILDAPFEVRVRTPERRLDELPRPLRVDQPWRVATQVALRTGFRGNVSILASHPTSEACTEGLPAVVHVEGDLRDAQLDVQLRGSLGEHRAATASTRIEAPLRTWLLSGFPEALPPIDLRARVDRLDLASAPIVCEQASGLLALEADVEGLFGARPRMRARGDIDALSIAGTEPLRVELNADADIQRARVDVTAHSDGRRALRAHAAIPLAWDEGIPALADAEWRGRIKLRQMPVTPLLILAPNVRQPRGAVTGDVRLRARGDDVRVEGGLELADVSAILERPFIRLDALNGAIRIREDAIVLDDLRYRDRDGRVRLSGTIGMEGMVPRSADIRANLDSMPFRVEGVEFATVDADMEASARLSDTENEIEVSLSDVDVQLPEDAGRVVQSLDVHEDVVYVDDVGFEAAMAQSDAQYREERARRDAPPMVTVPTRIRVRTTPFWVRREDFSIQLDARLRVLLDPDARLVGRVQVRRGFIELLGKNFEFQQGEIRFAGGRDVDPTLDLQADHELRTGETVSVRITGHLSRPQLAFSTTVPGVQSEREVVQLLVSGRSSSAEVRTAQDQASSALAGLMAGFLSTLTRRELGAYVPVFRVEAGGTNTARVRAGFSADDIIPEFMRGVVVGAYVEGYVGTDQNDGGAQRTTGGVLIELLHPRNIVTRSTWEEPNNWSLDFIWEPL